jgi:hypothetical protein
MACRNTLAGSRIGVLGRIDYGSMCSGCDLESCFCLEIQKGTHVR